MSSKKIKTEKVLTGINEYLKKRNYDTASAGSSGLTINEQQTGILNLISPSTPNAFSFSTTSASSSLIDQQYLRLKTWMTEASEPCRTELSQVLFPLFVHLYLELVSSSGKNVGNTFFNRHYSVFLVNRDYEITLRHILHAANDANSLSVLQSLKNGKYTVKFSDLTLNYFLRYLKSNHCPTLLQIFNTYIDVEVDDSGGASAISRLTDNTQVNLNNPLSEGNSADFTTLDQDDMANLDCSELELLQVKDVIDRVRMSDPVSPSLCVYYVSNAYNGLSAAKVNSDARYLACGFEDSLVKIWKLTQPTGDKSILERFIKSEKNPTKAAPSQTILACDYSRVEEDPYESVTVKEEPGKNGRTRGNGKEGGEMLTLRGHSGPVYDLAFTDTSSHLLSVGEDASMRLWDLEKGETVCIYTGHHYPISCLDVSAKTLYMATGCFDNTARLWSTECLNPLRTFCGHKKGVDCVAFHPNCSYVASGSADKSVRLWQINDGAVGRIFLHHQTPIKSVSFSPNGKYLASGSDDGNVIIWDLEGGKLLCELGQSSPSSSPTLNAQTPHSDPVVALCWSKDSTMLTSASSDGGIRTSYLTNSRSSTFTYELQEIGNVTIGNNSTFGSNNSTMSGGTLLHCSLTTHNYLTAVSALDVER